MKLSKCISILTLALSLLTSALSTRASVNVPQPEQGLWPESPQVAKLSTVTMPSPDLSTGAATFSLPLYTLTVDDLSMPIELRYRSNGIRVDEDPYPIGYGWSFLPALRVTRTVYNRPDGKYSFIGTGTSESLTHSQMHRAMIARAALGTSAGLDSERDIFTVHMPETSFNAYLENGTLKAPGHGEYKITTDSSLSYIKVTDPFGRVWKFAEIGARWLTEDPVEWCLTSVTLPTGKAISFTWGFGTHTPFSYGAYHSYNYFRPLASTGPKPDKDSAGSGNVGSTPASKSLNLTAITFPGGSISFTYKTSSSIHTTLSSMTVKAGTQAVRTVTLTHGTASTDNTMLKSVEISGGEKYSFEYNPYTFSSGDSQDYWGYYNRGSRGICDAPSMSISGNTGESTSIDGSNRSPNEDYMKARTLTKVTYPTGGTLEIEYEAHRFNPLNFIDDSRERAPHRRHVSLSTSMVSAATAGQWSTPIPQPHHSFRNQSS